MSANKQTQRLQRLEEEAAVNSAAPGGHGFVFTGGQYTIRVANDLESRRNAYRFVYQRYLEKEYAQPYPSKLFGFEVGGAEKACPKVQNAPALLLRLTREYVETQVRLTAGSYQRERNHRSLYPFFYAQEVEPFIAAFLKHRHKPMTAAEAERLGLAVHA
jgi:hypothetical protein